MRIALRARTMPAVVVLLLLGALLLAGSFPGGANAATAPPEPGGSSGTPSGGVELVLFWGDGCPHCEAERAWLEDAREEYPDLHVREYEVWYDAANRERMLDMAERLDFEPSGVPTTIIGEQVWVGFSDSVREEMEQAIEDAGTSGTPPPASGEQRTTVDVPARRRVAVGSSSLVVSTLVIGFVDGVNPCSLWVISVLLAIVVRTRSRRRVLAIGTTFLAAFAAAVVVHLATTWWTQRRQGAGRPSSHQPSDRVSHGSTR
jgi:thiol-disulfide isomerase/thioredoxin